MDEGARHASEVDAAAAGSGERTPEEIQREIDETRAELGDTVEALAQKADLKERAKEKAEALKQKKSELLARAKDASPDDAAAGAQQVVRQAQRNPLPLAVAGAFAAGLAIGRLTAR